MPKRKPAKRTATKAKPVKRSSGGKQTAPKVESAPDAKSLRRMLYDNLCERIKKGELRKAVDIKQWRLLKNEIEKDEHGAEPSSDIVESGDDAAAYCGVSKKVISDHIRKKKLKRNDDGTFDKKELNRYLAKYSSKPSEGGEAVESIREQQEKAELRYRLAKARREERLADQADGLLAPWAEIEAQWGERVRLVTSSLDKLPDRLPAILVGRSREEMHEILKTEIRDFRASFRRHGQYCPECKPKSRRSPGGR